MLDHSINFNHFATHSDFGQQKSMLDGYKILTVTHRNVHLEQISDFVLPHTDETELGAKLIALKENLNLSELLYTATCNRVIYLFRTDIDLDINFIDHFFKTINAPLSSDFIAKSVAAYEGKEAIVHFYEVASSIDSLVVGEREIMRQIRESYTQCKNWQLTGDHIRLLMKYLVQATKEVYAKTRIGEKPVSVVSLAMLKLRETNLPTTARILLVGAGQTNTLVSKFLLKQGYRHITVFNRSLENAQRLAESVNGNGYALSDLPNYKGGFDCLICCTGATEAIINTTLYQALLNGEQGEKVVVDLSIPNNISKEVITQFPTRHINIEILKELADLNLSLRKQEIGIAKILLTDQFKSFEEAFQWRQIEKAMRHVPEQVKEIKERAMKEVFKKDLEELDDKSRALIEEMMTYMEKKCISIPMKAAKELVE